MRILLCIGFVILSSISHHRSKTSYHEARCQCTTSDSSVVRGHGIEFSGYSGQQAALIKFATWSFSLMTYEMLIMIPCNQSCEGKGNLPDGSVCYVICQSWSGPAKAVPEETCELCGTCQNGECVHKDPCKNIGR
nr:uncharacterized protein LOC126524271 [Dermacentor andersoni]